ncbi:hypothetical protein RHS01_04186 [Rhizoctonia solani]|uniref:Uncharacterized protein n=1 Tax=Rhizoctonia solani TaxID=456999 RepID=A0A8H7IGS7_9AGAM|nr:hypothetical protein RHS01_04186 [Rhizoctonia solani]
MSQCPTASATPSTVLDSQPSGLLDATPYVSQIASTVWQSQELPLSQLTPRTLKRRLDLDSQEEGSQISCVLPPLSRRRLAVPSDREDLENGGSSIVPSMAPLESRESIVPAALKGRRTLGFFPKKEGASVVRGSVIFSLMLVMSRVRRQGKPLAMRTLISSEALNLWKYKGVRPHERLLVLRDDKGRFAPLSAYEYLKKEADAWEARYGNLTEEFLLGQCPAGLKAKTNRNEDFAYAMEAEDAEGFFGRLKERQPRDMAMGYNNLKAFTGYFYRDKGALPQGVCEPKALKKATVNLPPGVQEWVASNILERDPESDRGKILVQAEPQL